MLPIARHRWTPGLWDAIGLLQGIPGNEDDDKVEDKDEGEGEGEDKDADTAASPTTSPVQLRIYIGINRS